MTVKNQNPLSVSAEKGTEEKEVIFLDSSIVPPSEKKSNIHQHHWKEWVEGSGIKPELANLNLISLDDAKDIATHLNRDWYSHAPGWIFKSADIYRDEEGAEKRPKTKTVCFKPDQPAQEDPAEKPRKYLGARGIADILIPEMHHEKHWQKFLKSSSPLVITEGIKKALAVIGSTGYNAVALTGVTVWGAKAGDKKGKDKRQLLPRLRELSEGREVIILFDRDVHFNFNVMRELKALGTCLEDVAKSVSVALISENSEHKGIDDLLVNEGEEVVGEVLRTRRDFKTWETSNEARLETNPSDSIISDTIRRKYSRNLVYRATLDEFYLYQEILGYWMMLGVPDEKSGNGETIERFVQRVMREDLELLNFSDQRIKSIVSLLKRDLQAQWKVHPKIRNFQNGYYDTETKTFYPEWDRFLFLTEKPNYRYSASATCPNWIKYLNDVFEGDESVIKLIQCAFRLCVSPDPKFQKYLHFEGIPGTGKSTAFNVLTQLVGSGNYFNTSLRDLEENKYLMYTLITKNLVVVPDAEKYEGSPAKLKKLTGRDRVPLEAKFKQPSQDAVFEGMIAISSNDPIKFTYDGGALMRRRICIKFNKPIPDALIDRNLTEKLSSELSGIFNWVMDVSDEDLVNYLNNTKEYCPKAYSWNVEAQTNTDSVSDWADNSLILSTNDAIQVGSKKLDDNRNLMDTDKYLYPSYLLHCEGSNSKPVSQKEFTSRLITFLTGNLKLSHVAHVYPKNKSTIKGVRLRTSADEDIATLSRQANNDLVKEELAVSPFEEINEQQIRETDAEHIASKIIECPDYGTFLKNFALHVGSTQDREVLKIVWNRLTTKYQTWWDKAKKEIEDRNTQTLFD